MGYYIDKKEALKFAQEGYAWAKAQYGKGMLSECDRKELEHLWASECVTLAIDKL